MHAHVNTYRLGTTDETTPEIEPGAQIGGPIISDQAARTIASWWQSPAQPALTALASGAPFDTADLRREAELTVSDWLDCEALIRWAYDLEGQLSGGA